MDTWVRHMESPHHELGLILTKAAQRKGLGAGDLADKTGHQYHTVWRWLAGLSRPKDALTAAHVATLLDIDPDLVSEKGHYDYKAAEVIRQAYAIAVATRERSREEDLERRLWLLRDYYLDARLQEARTGFELMALDIEHQVKDGPTIGPTWRTKLLWYQGRALYYQGCCVGRLVSPKDSNLYHKFDRIQSPIRALATDLGETNLKYNLECLADYLLAEYSYLRRDCDASNERYLRYVLPVAENGEGKEWTNFVIHVTRDILMNYSYSYADKLRTGNKRDAEWWLNAVKNWEGKCKTILDHCTREGYVELPHLQEAMGQSSLVVGRPEQAISYLAMAYEEENSLKRQNIKIDYHLHLFTKRTELKTLVARGKQSDQYLIENEAREVMRFAEERGLSRLKQHMSDLLNKRDLT